MSAPLSNDASVEKEKCTENTTAVVIMCPICYEEKEVPDEGALSPTDNSNTKEELSEASSITTNDENDDDHESKKKWIVLPTCHHTFCSTCLSQWLSQNSTCPECRMELNPDEIQSLVGDITTNTAENESPSPIVSIDDLTLTWLQEQGARACPGCGIYIIKQDGCSNMMCRCGQRFDFDTGDARNYSDDGDNNHYEFGTYYDNVRQCEEDEDSDDSDDTNFWQHRDSYCDETSDCECGYCLQERGPIVEDVGFKMIPLFGSSDDAPSPSPPPRMTKMELEYLEHFGFGDFGLVDLFNDGPPTTGEEEEPSSSTTADDEPIDNNNNDDDDVDNAIGHHNHNNDADAVLENSSMPSLLSNFNSLDDCIYFESDSECSMPPLVTRRPRRDVAMPSLALDNSICSESSSECSMPPLVNHRHRRDVASPLALARPHIVMVDNNNNDDDYSSDDDDDDDDARPPVAPGRRLPEVRRREEEGMSQELRSQLQNQLQNQLRSETTTLDWQHRSPNIGHLPFDAAFRRPFHRRLLLRGTRNRGVGLMWSASSSTTHHHYHNHHHRHHHHAINSRVWRASHYANPDCIWTAVKVGNLSIVQQELALNPSLLDAKSGCRSLLYYASLCGHDHVCEYLIKARGAEGDYECFTVALNQQCRDLLRPFKNNIVE